MKIRPRWSEAGLAAVGYAALLAVLAWPLVTQPATALANPSGWLKADLDLLVWIVAWTAHAVVTQPLELFQANIFHPAADTLASSEHLLGLLPVTGPAFWLSGNAVLTYNLATLAVVWTAAFTMFLLVRTWTRRGSAAFLAGALFGLGPMAVGGFARLHSSAVHLYPLVLLLAWRAGQSPRPQIMIALVAATALQVLSGMYVACGLGVLAAASAPSLIAHARRHQHSGIAPMAGLAIGALPLALVALPYLRLRASGVMPDPEHALELMRATSGTVGQRVGLLGSEMTTVGLALAATGLFARRAEVGSRTCLCSIAVMGLVLGLGTNARLPGTDLPSVYEVLTRVVPGFSGFRAPHRFLYLTLLGLSGLAGLGAAALVDAAARRSGERTARVAASAFVALAVAAVAVRAEPWPVPVWPEPMSGLFVGAHRWLAEHGAPGPVLDLPARTSPLSRRTLRSAGRAMLGSTLHWYPLLNGYSGYPPPSYKLLMTLAQRLPDERALRDLCALTDLRWIVAHHALMPASEDAWRRVDATLPITRVAGFGGDAIYEVHCPAGGRAPPWRLPAPPLASDAKRVRLDVEIPTVRAGGLLRLWADVTNLGNETWPGLRQEGGGGVVLRTRWYDAVTGAPISKDPPLPLARDLRPGETVRAQLETFVPSAGDRRLEVEVSQEGGPAFTVVGPPTRYPVRVLGAGERPNSSS